MVGKLVGVTGGLAVTSHLGHQVGKYLPELQEEKRVELSDYLWELSYGKMETWRVEYSALLCAGHCIPTGLPQP
jgi:hypothetical protein